MRALCLQVAEECLPKQLEGAKFPHPPYLIPPDKGRQPFSGWSLDCITHLQPPGPHGETAIVLAVCTFSKWVEAAPMVDLKAKSLVTWFNNQIVDRYGPPVFVRTDRGSEFQAEFQTYCASMGIRARLISARNPRANGQAERYVRLIREGMRRMVTWIAGAEWYHVLQDVIRALRILPHRVTGVSPYLLVFKQHPHWHDRLEAVVAPPDDREVTEHEEQALLDHQEAFWKQLRLEVAAHLEGNDINALRRYRRQKAVASLDPRVIFREGNRVLLKSRVEGKMHTRAEGPYYFIRYVNTSGLTAVIKDTAGKEHTVSSSRLIALKGMQQLPGPTGEV